MSLAGLADKAIRSLKRSFKKLWALIPISKFRTDPEAEDEIPDQWIHKSSKTSREIKKGKLYIKKGKIVVSSRKLHHWPWLRYFKRGTAAILLLLNFAFTQFLLVTSGLQVVSLFFFFNCFIMLDYLWKTRRAPAEE